MNESDVVDYLQRNSIPIKRTSPTQFILDCPVCGREDKVYMGKTNGIWDCKSGNCGAKGNLMTFAKAMPKLQDTSVISKATVDRYVALLKTNIKAQEYLASRGYTAETVLKTHVGVNEHGAIVIPYFDCNNRVYAFKYRNLDFDGRMQNYETLRSQGIQADKPNKWYGLGQPGLWGLERIDKNKPLIITEGEWDALTLLQWGENNVCAAPGATNRSWIDDVKDVKNIYICYDTDGAGRTGAFELATRLGLHRCYNVVIPSQYKDINEALQAGYTLEEFKQCIRGAEKFPVAGISKPERFEDLIVADLLNPGKMKGPRTGFTKLDEVTGGFAEQELRVISGLTKTGKTTWIMHEFLQYARQDIPVAIFSLETPVKDVLKNMIRIIADNKLEDSSETEIRQSVRELNKLPIHVFDGRNFEDSLSITKFKELVKQCRDRYGVKYVVLDDLDFLVTSTPHNSNENETVSRLMTELKTMANTLNLHVVVIAHINKASGKGLPSMHDIKGSSAIMQRADYVMLIHRETAADADLELKADVTVVIDKNRPTGIDGIIHYKYDKDSKKYKEM